MPRSGLRTLALPMLGNIVQGVVWGVFFGVLLPSFASLHGHLDNYGIVVASNAAAMAVFSIPGGRLSDILGRRRVILVGWAIMSLSPFLLLGRTTMMFLVAAAVVHGIGGGTSISAFQSYIADISKKKKMASNFGALTAVSLAFAAMLTFGMGRWVDSFSTPEQGLDMGFLIIGVLLCIGTLSSLGFQKTEILTRPPALKLSGIMNNFSEEERKVVIDMTILQTVTGVGAALTVQFYVPFFIDKFGVAQGSLFVLSAVGTGLLAFSTLMSGIIGDRTNKLRFVLASNILAVPMAFGILLSPVFETAAVFFVARMALANMIWPVWTAFFMSNLRPQIRGLANGMAGAAWNLVYIPSAFMGWKAMKWTGGWTIPLSVIMYVTVTSYVVWHLKDLGKREREDRKREDDALPEPGGVGLVEETGGGVA